MYQSSRIKSNEGFMALTVSEIKPANVLTRITDLFKKPVKGIVLKTHATNDADFVKSLRREHVKSGQNEYEQNTGKLPEKLRYAAVHFEHADHFGKVIVQYAFIKAVGKA